MGLEDLPYEIANISAEQCKAFAHTRVGWYRSVSNIPRAFAVQSITAALAHELGREQKAFPLEMVGTPRKIAGPATGRPQKIWKPHRHSTHFPSPNRRPP